MGWLSWNSDPEKCWTLNQEFMLKLCRVERCGVELCVWFEQGIFPIATVRPRVVWYPFRRSELIHRVLDGVCVCVRWWWPSMRSDNQQEGQVTQMFVLLCVGLVVVM